MAKHHKKDQVFHTVDLWHVEDSRVVFAFFDKRSKSRYAGTSTEVGYARALGKHLIIVSTLTKGMNHYYQFPIRMADERDYFKSLDDGIEHLRQISIKYNGGDNATG
jgi:nucleoside 2-deoxyribosyltransferase